MIMKKSYNFFDLVESIDESDSFEELYSKYFTKIYRYVFMRLHDKETSMDIVQMVFLKAFQHKESIRYDESLRYLYTIARNQLIDHLRKKHTIHLNDFDGFIENMADMSIPRPDSAAVFADNVHLVEMLLKKLPESQREIITLHYINELDYFEMALITGKSESTLRQSVSRGLRTLQEIYQTHLDYE